MYWISTPQDIFAHLNDQSCINTNQSWINLGANFAQNLLVVSVYSTTDESTWFDKENNI